MISPVKKLETYN